MFYFELHLQMRATRHTFYVNVYIYGRNGIRLHEQHERHMYEWQQNAYVLLIETSGSESSDSETSESERAGSEAENNLDALAENRQMTPSPPPSPIIPSMRLRAVSRSRSPTPVRSPTLPGPVSPRQVHSPSPPFQPQRDSPPRSRTPTPPRTPSPQDQQRRIRRVRQLSAAPPDQISDENLTSLQFSARRLWQNFHCPPALCTRSSIDLRRIESCFVEHHCQLP